MPRCIARNSVRSLSVLSPTYNFACSRPVLITVFPFRSFTSSRTNQSAPYPTVPHCPEPTCFCSPTPKLEIDRQADISATVPFYNQHVVIHTGRQDWRSRIEDEGATDEELAQAKGNKNPSSRGFIDGKESITKSSKNLRPGHEEIGLARGLKNRLGRAGKWFDPTHTVLVTNSSFHPPENSSSAVTATIFPSFRRISGIPDDSFGYETFIKGLLADSRSFPFPEHWTDMRVDKPVVLICSHGSRDSRCGTLGPLLHTEFKRQLSSLGLSDLSHNVAMSSHVGGHKWAGNVIIYLPHDWPLLMSGPGGLRGKGVWYARIEPKHVEGLIRETIIGGRVIEELSRGVVF